jgi:hypothetical protein
MKLAVAALVAATLAAPALAQAPAAAPAAAPADGSLPVCSKEVLDRCVQGPTARRSEAQEFNEKFLGRDRSAQLTPKQAAAGMKAPQ